MALTITPFSSTGSVAAHPTADVTVPAGFKVVGGGAIDNWTGAGNLLTASFPKSGTIWSAAGKDHEVSSPASLTVFALGLNDPQDEWEVFVAQQTSDRVAHPVVVATLPDGFTLTGGGAFVEYHGAGNILTASFPHTDSMSWEARSKDHDISDPAKLTVFAIGIRPRKRAVTVTHQIKQVTGSVAAHPTSVACLDPGFTLSGGGALDNWTGDGNLLTASFPQNGCWSAAGKDHVHSSPASITCFAIGIQASE